MISVACSMCGSELDAPGAILLGPPDAQGMVKKDHLCVGCYEAHGKLRANALDVLAQAYDYLDARVGSMDRQFRTWGAVVLESVEGLLNKLRSGDDH